MSGWRELQETAQAMAELLETQIAPQLPPRPSDTFEFNVQVSPQSLADSSE